MWEKLTAEVAPAWVQAIGSIIAILVAVAVPAWQRWSALRDAKIEKERQKTEQLWRLVTALRAEIEAAVNAAERRQVTAEATLADLARAREAGITIAPRGPPLPGTIVITDAIIYRQLGSEIGHLSPTVIRRVVAFYALALDTERVPTMAASLIEACEAIRDLMPKARMNGAMLVAALDKLEKAEFAAGADLTMTPEEIRGLARQTGYQLEQS